MSTHTTRLIEYRTECFNRKAIDYDKMVERYHDVAMVGDYFTVSHGENKYYEVNLDQEGNKVFTPINAIPTQWHLLEFPVNYTPKNWPYYDNNEKCWKEKVMEPDAFIHYNDKKETRPISIENSFCNNGGMLRDNWLRKNAWKGKKVCERGLPEDVTKETKKLVGEEPYIYGITNVSLDEWIDIYDEEFEKVKKSIIEKANDNKLKRIEDKLNCILNKEEYNLTPEDDEMYESSFDYLFDEDLGDVLEIKDEITKVYSLVETLTGELFIEPKNIRIIYYLS